MIIILDTGFLFALNSKKDRHHTRAYEIFDEINKQKTKYFTNYAVMDETLTLATIHSHGNISFLNSFVALFIGKDNFFNIVQFGAQEFAEIAEIYKKYITPKKLLSFTDASLIYLFQKLKADYIISFDSHFDNILDRKY